jgi:hypothetical protein
LLFCGREEKKKALDRLTAFLSEQPKWQVGKKLALKDVHDVLAIAKKHDARVHELMTLLVTKPASFCVFDVEMYAEYLLRGKKGEPWNKGDNVVGPLDVCIARNGGGDPYVWNAESGEVRFLVHDEGWSARSTYDDVDAFVEEVMLEVVEAADADQVEEATPQYIACLRFAIEIAGDDSLDDDARDKLSERSE